MNRRFRSLAAGLGLVGALASCGDDGVVDEWVFRLNNAPFRADRELPRWEPCEDGVGHYVTPETRVPAPPR